MTDKTYNHEAPKKGILEKILEIPDKLHQSFDNVVDKVVDRLRKGIEEERDRTKRVLDDKDGQRDSE